MDVLERGIRCSFCDKKQEDAKHIILSPTGRGKPLASCICDECVADCVRVIEEVTQNSETVFGIEMSDLERMESMGFITTEAIQGLSGSVIDFLLQLWNMMASAKRKLDEADKTELGKQISKISSDISQEEESLLLKKAELEQLKKKLAKMSG